jgi:hypothetical protein
MGRFIVKKHSVLCLGLGVVLSIGILDVGCSSDSTSPVDAGKKDGSAGKDGGNGGSAGSTGVGGSGSGGSATGGNVGSGGTIGSGGSASGGSSGTGGAGGTVIGGSSGTGGSATGGSSGTGGAISVDGGPVDVGGDALDAPMGGNDAAIDSGSVDTGTVSLDVGAVDVSVDAPEIDTALALDMGIDISPVDMSGVDTGNPIPCDTVHMISLGDTGGIPANGFGTTGSYCFATCDDIQGWGASNMAGRGLLVINGKQIDLSTGVGSLPLPTPKYMDTYTVFQVSAGTYDYARVYWWGTGHVCAAPAGGFGLN